MWKTLLAGTAAAAIAGSVVAYAQPSNDGAPRDPAAQNQPNQTQPPFAGRLTREDRAALFEARMAGRLAALKTGLQLTPEQERLWPPYEAAVRDMIKLHRDRVNAPAPPRAAGEGAQQGGNVDRLSEIMRRRADMLTAEGQVLGKLAAARAPLIASFDSQQQRRFAMLSRPVRLEALGRRHGHDRGDHRDGMMDRRDRSDFGNRPMMQGHGRMMQGYGRMDDDSREGFRGGQQGGRDFRGRGDDDRGGRGAFRRDDDRGNRQYRDDDDQDAGRRGSGRRFWNDRSGAGSDVERPRDRAPDPRSDLGEQL